MLKIKWLIGWYMYFTSIPNDWRCWETSTCNITYHSLLGQSTMKIFFISFIDLVYRLVWPSRQTKWLKVMQWQPVQPIINLFVWWSSVGACVRFGEGLFLFQNLNRIKVMSLWPDDVNQFVNPYSVQSAMQQVVMAYMVQAAENRPSDQSPHIIVVWFHDVQKRLWYYV